MEYHHPGMGTIVQSTFHFHFIEFKIKKPQINAGIHVVQCTNFDNTLGRKVSSERTSDQSCMQCMGDLDFSIKG